MHSQQNIILLGVSDIAYEMS